MFRNLKVGIRLFISFLVVVVLLVLSMVVSVSSLKQMAVRLSTFFDSPFVVVSQTWSAKRSMAVAESEMYKAATTMSLEGTGKSVDLSEKAIEELNVSVGILEKKFLDEQQLLSECKKYISQAMQVRKGALELLLKNQNSQALEIINLEYMPLIQNASQLLEEIGDIAQTQAHNFVKSGAESEFNTMILMLVILSICIVVTIAICIAVTKSIIKPVEQVGKSATAMSNGNLYTTIAYQSKDEVGQLADDMRKTMSSLQMYIKNISYVLSEIADGNMQVKIDMDYVGDFSPIKTSMEQIINSLNDTIMQINIASQSVSSGSTQVSNGASALSQGATEQASAIDELSASIIEISEQVRLNANGANNISEKVDNVGNHIQKSNHQMDELTTAMVNMNEASKRIEKIIKTIEDIAFQTNILALNAAVEAARAGESGKGFAVVADEVRSLASKSAEAAKNTTTLIQQSIQAVEYGTNLAIETAKGMNEVSKGSKEVVSLINNIAYALNEQATEISQIALGVDQISAVVQTNSATAQESAAASEELSGQSTILNNLVKEFKLKDSSVNHSVGFEYGYSNSSNHLGKY